MTTEFKRTTPSKSTPERIVLESLIAEYDTEHDKYLDEICKVQKQLDNTRKYSKKAETLKAKVDKLKDKKEAYLNTKKPLQAQRRQMHFEDIAEEGDEANRISALNQLNYDPNAYQKIKELALAEAREQSVPELHLERIALQAASLVNSYPGTKSLKQQIELETNHWNLEEMRRLARKVIDELEFIDKKDRAYFWNDLTRSYSQDETDRIVESAKLSNEQAKERHKRAEEFNKVQETIQRELCKFYQNLSTFPVRVVPLKRILEKPATRSYSFVKTARETGWVTNGIILFKVTAKDKKDLNAMPEEEGTIVRQEALNSTINVPCMEQPATLSGIRQAKDIDRVVVYLLSCNDRYLLVNANLYKTMMSRYPNATAHITEDVKYGMVVFKWNGTIVGVLKGMDDAPTTVDFHEVEAKKVEEEALF